MLFLCLTGTALLIPPSRGASSTPRPLKPIFNEAASQKSKPPTSPTPPKLQLNPPKPGGGNGPTVGSPKSGPAPKSGGNSFPSQKAGVGGGPRSNGNLVQAFRRAAAPPKVTLSPNQQNQLRAKLAARKLPKSFSVTSNAALNPLRQSFNPVAAKRSAALATFQLRAKPPTYVLNQRALAKLRQRLARAKALLAKR